ncbi:hypothetical protein JOD78_003565 [Herbaspirillum sp. 1130]|nr:hypothetical protein [Herbaspirillum sp. 1130]
MPVPQIHSGSTALPKFCIHCEHCKHGKYSEAACTNPRAAIIDLVHGLRAPQCSEARKSQGKCGPDAKLFAKLVGNAVSGVSQGI